jgi:hypothetical protein
VSLLDALGTAADVISTPGQLVRGLLAGRPGDMLSGQELLQQYGLASGDDMGSTLAGVGTDIATDPLTYAGGALARALLGGKMRPVQTAIQGGRLGPDQQVFDLMPNWQANAGRNMSPRVIHYAEDVTPPADEIQNWLATLTNPHDRDLAESAGREAMRWREASDPMARYPVRLADEVSPLSDVPELGAGAKPLPVLDTSPLDRLPHPQEYGMGIGYGPEPTGPGSYYDPAAYDPARHGVPGDRTQEGDLAGALATRLGGWNDALFDLERMPPLVRQRMAEAGLMHSHFGGDIAPEVEAWRRAMLGHVGDIDLMMEADQAVKPEARHLLGDLAQQRARLHEFIGEYPTTGHGSPAKIMQNDLARGMIDPSDLRDLYLSRVSHLPLDEAALRRLAAHSQFDSSEEALTQLGQILEEMYPIGGGEAWGQNLPPLAQMGYDETMLRTLQDRLTPSYLTSQHGINPGIARQVFAGSTPRTAELMEGLSPWRDVMARMEPIQRAAEAARAARRDAIAARYPQLQAAVGRLYGYGPGEHVESHLMEDAVGMLMNHEGPDTLAASYQPLWHAVFGV